LIMDETLSALDQAEQFKLLDLFDKLQKEYDLTYIFISHDLAMVRKACNRVAVMYLGRLCEVAPSEQLFARPAHPYTALLLQAIPVPDPDVRPAESVAIGEPPSPIAPPSGCRFRTRCPRADQRCSAEMPELREVAPGQFAACHHPLA
ncbi:ABC transporter ATP-binding protein, partial [Herbaspirillum sp. HC18]